MTMPTVDNTLTSTDPSKQSPAKQGIVSSLTSLINNRPEIQALGFGAVVVICATVLSGLHDATPSWFQYVATFAVGGGAGAMVQKGNSNV